MEFIKYLVILVLPVLALLISKRYAAFVDSMIDRAKGYEAFLCHIERKIGAYLTPPHRLGEGFSHPMLEGMIERISTGERLIDAYLACRESLPSSVDEILVELFGDFGTGDASLELRRVREAAARLKKAISAEEAEGDKQKKICAGVAPSLALGLVIWML